jgi:hypothetical protein
VDRLRHRAHPHHRPERDLRSRHSRQPRLRRVPVAPHLDIDAARARVEALPWVKQATLTKLFPDTLDIAVVEREPFALWQYAGVVRLIDDEGR